MKRLTAAVLLLGFLQVAALAQRAVVTEPWVGITYVQRTDEQPRPVRMHVVQVNLAAPGVRLKLSPPAGSKEVVRQTTLEFLRQERAQVAINAHFFWPFPSPDQDVELIGIAASEGRVYSGFESPVQSYALVARAPAINIDALNQAALVHWNPAQADGKGVREAVALWTALAGSAQIVTDGQVTVPQYKDAVHPDGALTPGSPAQYSNDKSWYSAVNARTAIGLSRDLRTLTLFTVDARDGSAGMTVAEVAARLVAEFGVWHALNLDGGGSTTMAMQDPRTGAASIVNVPSDGPSGRAVGSSLAIFAGTTGTTGTTGPR